MDPKVRSSNVQETEMTDSGQGISAEQAASALGAREPSGDTGERKTLYTSIKFLPVPEVHKTLVQVRTTHAIKTKMTTTLIIDPITATDTTSSQPQLVQSPVASPQHSDPHSLVLCSDPPVCDQPLVVPSEQSLVPAPEPMVQDQLPEQPLTDSPHQEGDVTRRGDGLGNGAPVRPAPPDFANFERPHWWDTCGDVLIRPCPHWRSVRRVLAWVFCGGSFATIYLTIHIIICLSVLYHKRRQAQDTT